MVSWIRSNPVLLELAINDPRQAQRLYEDFDANGDEEESYEDNEVYTQDKSEQSDHYRLGMMAAQRGWDQETIDIIWDDDYLYNLAMNDPRRAEDIVASQNTKPAPSSNYSLFPFDVQLSVDNHIPNPIAVSPFIATAATFNFIHRRLINRYSIPIEHMQRPEWGYGVAGSYLDQGWVTYHTAVPLTMMDRKTGHREEIQLHVTDFGKHDIILGLPWLKQHEVAFGSSGKGVSFPSENCRQLCFGQSTRKRNRRKKGGRRWMA